ncbi:hypothetical protein DFH08DRAFT_818578 [Mycena albidolilacea]|uniref:Uncharacterized protein n=1 Tax=Mycena albidolilacea TaxID=1033008 RepID=A0AAD7EHM8_9AGAR|nr:hypothetical protein DFH08DRAFT_818578 [Mycena albidolilacea]
MKNTWLDLWSKCRNPHLFQKERNTLQHYVDSIRRLGSGDRHNTESLERLHVDFFMVLWLQRQEAIVLHCSYLEWLSDQTAPPTAPDDENVTVGHLYTAHGAENLIPALTTFLKVHFKSSPTPGQYDCFNIINQISVHLSPNCYISNQSRSNHIRTILTVAPKGCSAGSPVIFDTALVIEDPSQYVPSSGIASFCPAQIHVIFRLPPQFGIFPHPLAYIKWFTPLNKTPSLACTPPTDQPVTVATTPP